MSQCQSHLKWYHILLHVFVNTSAVAVQILREYLLPVIYAQWLTPSVGKSPTHTLSNYQLSNIPKHYMDCFSPYITPSYRRDQRLPLSSVHRHFSPFPVSLLVPAPLGLMAPGAPRPGMQQQEGWGGSASAPPLGASGPGQPGAMPGRMGPNPAPMRPSSQPRPMLQSPMMANGESSVYLKKTRLHSFKCRN